MAEYRAIRDEELAALARGEQPEQPVDLGDLAAELLRLRRYNRGDNRTSMQIRRLRWAVENLIVKAESFVEARTGSPVLAVAFGRFAEKLGALHDQVVNLPLSAWGPRSQNDYTGGPEPKEGASDGKAD